MGRSADNHYSTMSVAEIMALQLPATRSSALYLWAIPSMLEHALQAMRHFGYTPKSQMVWVKPSIGLGKCFRNRHEILLYGTRGCLPRLGGKPDSVIAAPRGIHSAKPAAFADAIVKMYPDLPRIELFARVRRKGWDSWGNQLEPVPEAPASCYPAPCASTSADGK
jgi:N6-adenosine-specific RNA methylase IME4